MPERRRRVAPTCLEFREYCVKCREDVRIAGPENVLPNLGCQRLAPVDPVLL